MHTVLAWLPSPAKSKAKTINKETNKQKKGREIHWTNVSKMAEAWERGMLLNDESVLFMPFWLCIWSLLFSSAECTFFYLSALGSLVLPSACSGQVGLLHQREKSTIFLVCLSLWHLNKPEKCINSAKDWSQSDGWAGIISHSSFSVFIAINFKSGNRAQEHDVLGRKFAHLWLMGISITSLLPWLSELHHC